MGAGLTGLMILLFLGDWRSSLIVVITIPFALLMAVVLLRFTGQTINIMTLGGLALAVGVLVDEGTVLMENVHVHLAQGEKKAQAVLAASREVAIPRLLAMLSVLAVFLPSFFMTGPAHSLFVPLSLAVGFSMGASYLLSSSLVPVLANWILKQEKNEAEHPKEERFDRFRKRFQGVLERIMEFPKSLLGAYALVALLIIVLLGPRLAEEIFPSSASTQFRLRIDAPDGTRVAVTEALVQKVLATVSREAGAGNLDLTLGYVGTQPSSYPINTVFLWTSGSQQAIMNVGLNPGAKISLRSLEEKLRQKLPQEFPGTHFSFDPGDLISQTLNFGAPSSAEVAITGPQYADVNSNTGTHPLLSQAADIQSTTVPGELDRQNGMWMIIASANVGNSDFARAAKEIDRAIAKAGQAPRGVTTQVRGQVSALKQIFTELAIGLALAVIVILLLLTANFQSFRLALVVISSVPAVLVGAILMLLLTGTTLNLESFMGTIMAIGVAVANAILLVTFAEQNRRNGADPVSAARSAAAERLRPVLMTSLAMIAGMVPMSLAICQGR